MTSSCIIWVCHKPNDRCPFRKEMRGHIRREAEVGGMWPQSQDCGSHQKLGWAGHSPPYNLGGSTAPATPVYFQPPELGETRQSHRSVVGWDRAPETQTRSWCHSQGQPEQPAGRLHRGQALAICITVYSLPQRPLLQEALRKTALSWEHFPSSVPITQRGTSSPVTHRHFCQSPAFSMWAQRPPGLGHAQPGPPSTERLPAARPQSAGPIFSGRHPGLLVHVPLPAPKETGSAEQINDTAVAWTASAFLQHIPHRTPDRVPRSTGAVRWGDMHALHRSL